MKLCNLRVGNLREPLNDRALREPLNDGAFFFGLTASTHKLKGRSRGRASYSRAVLGAARPARPPRKF